MVDYIKDERTAMKNAQIAKKRELSELAESTPNSKAYENFKRKPYQAVRNLIHTQGKQMEDKINE